MRFKVGDEVRSSPQWQGSDVGIPSFSGVVTRLNPGRYPYSVKMDADLPVLFAEDELEATR